MVVYIGIKKMLQNYLIRKKYKILYGMFQTSEDIVIAMNCPSTMSVMTMEKM